MNIGYIQLGELASDPPSPQNGMKWYNSTLQKFRCYEDGVTRDENTGGGLTNTQIQARARLA